MSHEANLTKSKSYLSNLVSKIKIHNMVCLFFLFFHLFSLVLFFFTLFFFVLFFFVLFFVFFFLQQYKLVYFISRVLVSSLQQLLV